MKDITIYLKLNNKYDYFVCTSNVDGYFFRAGYDSNKIYEVHGSVNNLQCMDKNCNIKNGIIPLKKEMVLNLILILS